MVRRTTINLDSELVAQAREVLKGKNTTDTVHAALREVIRRERLRRLAQRRWGMTLEELKEMRRSRVASKPWDDLGGSPSDLRPSARPSEDIPDAQGSAVKRPRAA
jgi:Arc/MetJ family transcription regulator